MQPEPLDETVPLTDKQYRELNLYKVGDLQGKVSGWSIRLTLYSIGYFYAPKATGRHIVIALSVRPSVHQLIRPSVPLRVRCISPRFFEVGIPNLVCGYILGWWSVAYHFRVTVTLTSDLVFRIIVSGAYLLYYLR